MQGEAEGASILIRFKAIGDEQYMEQVTQDLKKSAYRTAYRCGRPLCGQCNGFVHNLSNR